MIKRSFNQLIYRQNCCKTPFRYTHSKGYDGKHAPWRTFTDKVNHPMPLTIAEIEAFKNSVTFLNQLRAIPLPIIEFYLESECGYRI